MKVAPFYPEESSQASQEPVKLFDVVVTRTVGSVFSGGSQSPRVAAFTMVAMEDMDGNFSFPDEDGRKVTVTVSTEERSR